MTIFTVGCSGDPVTPQSDDVPQIEGGRLQDVDLKQYYGYEGNINNIQAERGVFTVTLRGEPLVGVRVIPVSADGKEITNSMVHPNNTCTTWFDDQQCYEEVLDTTKQADQAWTLDRLPAVTDDRGDAYIVRITPDSIPFHELYWCIETKYTNPSPPVCTEWSTGEWW